MILALVIVSCGDEEVVETTNINNTNETVEIAEPTATPIPEPTATPIPEPTSANYPVTITDKLNQNINITNKPKKIVSISPTATEMIYKIGGEVIARDRASIYPLSVMNLPSIGSAYSPNMELIVEQSPDLVVMEALTQARFVENSKNSEYLL